MVTAAEFRIYKMASTHLLNGTLHVSMFEVVREQSNRESDLFFLDLQTLRAGDEGWLVLDVTAASDRWLLSRNKDLGLRLYVETDDGEAQGWAADLLPGAPLALLAAERAAAPSLGPGGLAFLSPAPGVTIPAPPWGSAGCRGQVPAAGAPYHSALPPLLVRNPC
uniref:bone morphogenetic protein 8A-like n=1 Tax=Panthera onca TaxID=9690 RepID=UPI0029531ECF|nr:bone morphogenetic protein 8A-like [Panthera onca]